MAPPCRIRSSLLAARTIASPPLPRSKDLQGVSDSDNDSGPGFSSSRRECRPPAAAAFRSEPSPQPDVAGITGIGGIHDITGIAEIDDADDITILS